MQFDNVRHVVAEWRRRRRQRPGPRRSFVTDSRLTWTNRSTTCVLRRHARADNLSSIRLATCFLNCYDFYLFVLVYFLSLSLFCLHACIGGGSHQPRDRTGHRLAKDLHPSIRLGRPDTSPITLDHLSNYHWHRSKHRPRLRALV